MDIKEGQDPFALFQQWLGKAYETEPEDANAMALATVSAAGKPSIRMVLLKDAGADGFSFYTNSLSRKGQEMAQNAHVAACFHWKSLHRQVRIEGVVETLPAPVIDAYFKTRHYLSRLGAWASEQSRPLLHREELEQRVLQLQTQYPTDDVPRPPHWLGYRIVPSALEFWQQGEGRLHDRFLFTKTQTEWRIMRLNP